MFFVRSTGNEADRSELKAEIEILRQCKDPNIVNYYGCYFRQHELLVCGLSEARWCLVQTARFNF